MAAIAEIGGAWLVWQGWREHRGLSWIAGGFLALGACGFVATFQPDPNFGRIPAAYGGIEVVRLYLPSTQIGGLGASQGQDDHTARHEPAPSELLRQLN